MQKRRNRRLRIVTFFASLAALASSVGPAAALEEHYPSDGDHPLRLAYYFVYPVGRLLEETVTKPMWQVGRYVAPYDHIDRKGFGGCSRERPARSCTDVIK